MLYELILINEIEQRAKIFFLSVDQFKIWFTLFKDWVVYIFIPNL